MKKMAAGEFKAKCYSVLAEVQKKRMSVLITKRGKPVAKLVPLEYDEKKDDIFGFMKGKMTVLGDVISPALTKEEWGRLWPEDD